MPAGGGGVVWLDTGIQPTSQRSHGITRSRMTKYGMVGVIGKPGSQPNRTFTWDLGGR